MTTTPLHHDSSNADDAEAADSPSRSQLKREAEEVTQLGQTLSQLSVADLAKIPFEERVADAVNELRRMRSFGARKRQLHFLGKILRNSDLTPIRDALQSIQLESQAQNKHFHDAERRRDQLLNDGQPALEDFLSEYPKVDRQRLRQLIRNHQREVEHAATGKPPSSKSAREVFKLVRDALSGH